MNMNEKNSYNGLILDKEKFLAKYSQIENLNDEYCLKMFEDAIQAKDSDMVEEALLLTMFLNYFSSNFSKKLCQLINADWHYKHEDIAMTLKEINDPSTVDCLFSAAQLNLKYLDYDDTFQFARKCIKAISEINTINSLTKLRILAKNKNIIIQEYAIKELRYKGLTH